MKFVYIYIYIWSQTAKDVCIYNKLISDMFTWLCWFVLCCVACMPGPLSGGSQQLVLDKLFIHFHIYHSHNYTCILQNELAPCQNLMKLKSKYVTNKYLYFSTSLTITSYIPCHFCLHLIPQFILEYAVNHYCEADVIS